MKELTLKELQDEGLNILVEIHEFCKQHNLRYSLAYGSLIGAIRHKGYIPWDDDMDIIMPRQDYDIFFSSFKSDRYYASSYENDINCIITYGRVCDTKETMVDNPVPWNKKTYGVWVDVFPVDSVEDDFEEYCKRFSKISRRFHLIQHVRGTFSPATMRSTFKAKATWLVKRIVFLNGSIVRPLIKQTIRDSKKYVFGDTKHWGLISFDSYGTKDYHDNSLFSDVILLPFEQHEFYVLSGYDAYLRHIYGDYMKLPPEKDRKPKQSSLKFYWKEK